MADSAPSAPVARRWFRFSLRTLLIFAPLLTIAFTWGGTRWYASHVQAWAVKEVERHGGLAVRDEQQYVTHVELPGRTIDDASLRSLMPALQSFPRLESLVLASNAVSDEGLDQLIKLTKLKVVYLADTQVTPAGVAKLQERQPNLKVDLITPNPRATKLAVRVIYNHAIVALAIAPDGTLVSGAGDGQVRLWDLSRRRMSAEFSAHQEWTFNIARHPQHPLLATGGGDGLIKLWNWNTGEEVGRFVGHEDDVHGVAFTPDGETLVSTGDDMQVRIWDVASRRPRFVLDGHAGTIPAIAISPDGRVAATASRDDTIRLWEIATGRHLGLFSGHTDDVLSVDFHPSGDELASASYDGTIKLWSLSERRAIATSAGHGVRVYGVRYSPDGNQLVSTAENGARLWQRAGLRMQWHTDPEAALSVPLWLDSHRIALASADGSITIRNEHSGHLATLWSRLISLP